MFVYNRFGGILRSTTYRLATVEGGGTMRVSLGGCFPALWARIHGMPEAKLDPAAERTGD